MGLTAINGELIPGSQDERRNHGQCTGARAYRGNAVTQALDDPLGDIPIILQDVGAMTEAIRNRYGLQLRA
ncbi:MAG: hypothetical protein JKY00_03500 [Roseicyclus sp.]|nr:hypothetical protein [Roseicyclus sp.]